MPPKARPRPRTKLARDSSVELSINNNNDNKAIPSTSKSTSITPTKSLNGADRKSSTIELDDSDIEIIHDDDNDDDEYLFFSRNNGSLWKRDIAKNAKKSKKLSNTLSSNALDESTPISNSSNTHNSSSNNDINNNDKDKDESKDGVIEILSSSEDDDDDDDDSNIRSRSSSPKYVENEDGTITDIPSKRKKKSGNERKKDNKFRKKASWTELNPFERMKEDEKWKSFNDKSVEGLLSKTIEEEKEDNDQMISNNVNKIDTTSDKNKIELTPPPEIKNDVSYLYNNNYNNRSTKLGTLDHDNNTNVNEDDQTDLNPLLLEIRQKLKNNEHHNSNTTDLDHGPPTTLLRTKVRLHPEVVEATPSLNDFQKVIKYNRSESFDNLFKYISQLINIPIESVVMTYENHRVFSATTPKSLNIWDEAEMEAMEITTYNYLKMLKEQDTRTKVELAKLDDENNKHNDINNESDDDSDIEIVNNQNVNQNNHNNDSLDVLKNDQNKIRLSLRGHKNEFKIKISVEKTIRNLLMAYLQNFNIDLNYLNKYKLEFDGDRLNLDSKINEIDLEDEE